MKMPWPFRNTESVQRSQSQPAVGAKTSAKSASQSQRRIRTPLYPRELRRPALEEGLHALLEVGPREALHHQLHRLVAGRTELARELLVHLPLHHHHRRARSVRGDLAHLRHAVRDQLLVRN